MSEADDEWYLDEGEADSQLTGIGGGNHELVLDVADAALLRDGLAALLLGSAEDVHVFVNPQANGSCRLLTIKLKPAGRDELPPS